MNRNKSIYKTYFSLRWKMLYRIFVTGGFIVTFAFIAISIIIVAFLYYSSSEYTTLIAGCLTCMIIENLRKDKEFLAITFPNPRGILRMDYLCICIPFMLVMAGKGEWWQEIVMLAVANALPYYKKMGKTKSYAFSLPFMYRGGMDMLYTARVIWWMLPLFLVGAFIGILSGNPNLMKVCAIVWSIVISFLMRDPQKTMIHYSGIKNFTYINIKMMLCDVSLMLVPFCIILAYNESSLFFALKYMLAGLLMSTSFLFIRYVAANSIFIILSAIAFVYIYAYSLFAPSWYQFIGYAGSILAISACLFLINSKYQYLWS